MANRIKPIACPFCKTVPTTERWGFVDGLMEPCPTWTALMCACGAQGPDIRTMGERWPAWRDEAVNAWNERAE